MKTRSFNPLWRLLLVVSLCLSSFPVQAAAPEEISAAPLNAPDSSNVIYVGGGFNDGGGIGAKYAASFNGSNWKHVGTDLTGTVRSLLADGTGDFYVGGEFSYVDGNAAINHIAFNNNGVWQAVGGGLNSTVSDMALNVGSLYAAGNFTDAGGVSAADRVAVLEGGNWKALGSGIPSGTVYSLAFYGGYLYAGGSFTYIDGQVTVKNIVRFDGLKWIAVGGGLNGTVYDLAVVGTDLVAVGAFTDAGPDLNDNYIARWNGTSWKEVGNGLGGLVYKIATDGTDLYIGGAFSDAGGDVNADRVARLDNGSWKALGNGLSSIVNALALWNGQLYAAGDSSNGISVWNGSVWSPPVGFANNVLTSLVTDETGGRLLVGGAFWHIGGDLSLDHFGAYDGSSWSALNIGATDFVQEIATVSGSVYVGGGFINAGGNLDADRIARWDGSAWQALGSGLTGVPMALLPAAGGLYAGGTFMSAGGVAYTGRIAFWTGSAWQPLGSGLNDSVNAMALSGTQVIAAGDFTDAGGNASADRIARWNGTAWQPLGSGLNDTVNALVVDGPNIYAGGLFTDAGSSTSADRIAMWNGADWQALGIGAANGAVNALLLTPDGLYAGGTFLNLGGVDEADYIALWKNGAWYGVGNGLNEAVNDLAIDADTGFVYAAGLFTNAGSDPDADYLARLETGAWKAVGAAMSNSLKAVAVGPAFGSCAPLTGTSLSGPAAGNVGQALTYAASLTPSDATPPFTYTFNAGGGQVFSETSNALTSQTVFSFSTPGEKLVNVSVQSCGGTVSDEKSITITAPPVAVNQVTISGPTSLVVGASDNFTAALGPANASPPFTYTWVVTDHTDGVFITSQTSHSRSLSWTTPGTKTLQVTVQNAAGQAVDEHIVTVQVTPPQPDLVVESIWHEGSVVHYTLRNQPGGGSVSSGHTTEFWIGPGLASNQVVTQNLKPGDTYSSFFDAPWACAGSVEQAKVCTDTANVVEESSESNNCNQVTWACEVAGPQMVTLPQVSAITSNSAVINFKSDITARGWVKFGSNPAALSEPIASTAAGTDLSVNLTGLQANTAYTFQAWAATRGGSSQVYSGAFRTLAEPPPPPEILSITMKRSTAYQPYQFYEIEAVVSGSPSVQLMRATLDGVSVGVQYTASAGHYKLYYHPFQLGMTYEEFYETGHELLVEIVSLSGEVSGRGIGNWHPPVEPRNVRVSLNRPTDGKNVLALANPAPTGTTISARMDAIAYDWQCTQPGQSQPVPAGASPVTCGRIPYHAVETMEIGILNEDRSLSYNPASGELEHDFTMNLAGLAVKSYSLVGKVLVHGIWTSIDSPRHFNLTLGMPNFEISRHTHLVDTHFEVTLIVKNTGSGSAQVTGLSDGLTGMQAVDEWVECKGSAGVKPGFCLVSVVADSVNEGQQTDLDFLLLRDGAPPLTILPGETLEFTYRTVPILYQTPVTAGFNVRPVTLRYLLPSGAASNFSQTPLDNDLAYDSADHLLPFSTIFPQAAANSNYLLVTNPDRLKKVYDDNPDHLLATMAELAALKYGVLGFLSTYDDQYLDALLDPDSDMGWVEQMHPNFALKNRGYVLLVGESEIIPSWYLGHNYFTTYSNIPDEVYQSDLPYANTGGGTARPELAVGRVIGDDVETLLKILNTSIKQARGDVNYTFDRSHAYVLSGVGSGDTSNFIPDINIIEDVLQDDGWVVTKRHWKYIHNETTIFKTESENQDVILFRDHGNQNVWDALSYVDVDNTNFGQTAPFAFGVACLAGNYDYDLDTENTAQSFMTRGAGVYIGSTQISERETNSYAAKYFFRHWPLGTAIAVALNNTKIATWDTDSGGDAFDHEKLWAYEFNLYGDPKYGLIAPPQTSSSDVMGLLAAPPATHNLNLPALAVETIEGFDHVTIPDGSVVLEPGYYQVPRWVEKFEIPAGYQVDDVHLTQRSGLVYTAGLNIPLMQAGVDCVGCTDPAPAPAQALVDGWTSDPSSAFEWSVEYNSDGSSTLLLRLFPYYYNPETLSSLYYPDYQFNISYRQNPAVITALRTNGWDYDLGATVPLTVNVDSTGPAQDLYLNVRILHGDGEIAAGLPVSALPALTGPGQISLDWNTTGIAADNYTIIAELLDSQGHLVDTADSEVALGRARAGLSLESAPKTFEPGASVPFSLRLSSSGSTPVSGVVTILVQSTSPEMKTLATFNETVTDLAPNTSLVLSRTWQSAGAPAGPYRILAYIQYQEGTSEPFILSFKSYDYVLYLPTIKK